MAQQLQFTAFSRLLHWTMAIMVLAMLFIVGMVASLSNYHWLISIHKPLGILILILVAIRLVNRLLNPAPPLPRGMPACQRFAAHGSHVVLYALLFALPLVGWAMLSAARYPIVLYGLVELPPILPHDVALRRAADDAHGLGLSLVRDVHRSFRRRADARADLPGRRVSEHGVLKPRLSKFSGTPQMTGSA
jgi:cytochrome b561